MRTDAPGPRLAAALLLVWGGLGPHEARAQADRGRPQALPEVQEDAPVGTPLSDELDRSNGVIAPPASTADTDQGMVRPAPDMGSTAMPVIPPPGTPGGNPDVRPK